jgi:hypothetical protein
MRIITDLIEDFDIENPHFRPTEIHNENWLLKAFLHLVDETHLSGSHFSFSKGASWFSEAMLPTAFRARYRGDQRAEARTNADGVIGHIRIGEVGKADLELTSNADQFVVIEAKISAPLSSGTRNAPGFDQAARNVACMAEVLRRARLSPREFETLKFIVLAPGSSIEAGTFRDEMDLEKMREKIRHRAATYDGELDTWFEKWVQPTLERISLHSVSWEQAIDELVQENSEAAAELSMFYELCLEYN